MSDQLQPDADLAIAHVLFIDIVAYSKLAIDQQKEAVQQLNQCVRESEQFRRADAAGKLIRIPTGDGVALAFFTSPDAACSLCGRGEQSGPQFICIRGKNQGIACPK